MLLLHAGFIVTGIMTTLIGPTLPELSARWLLSDAQAGNLFTAQFIGSMGGVGLSGVLASRRGYKFPIALGFSMMCLAAVALTRGSWGIGLISLFCNGIGLGLIIPSTNLLVANANPSDSAASLNLLNLSWGIGATVCPVVVALLIRAGGFYTLLSALAAGTALLAAVFSLGPSLRLDRDTYTAPKRSGFSKPKLIVVLGALFFLYLGTESSISGWVASYARRMNDSPDVFWMMSPSFFWGALLLGRALAPIILRWLNDLELARAALGLALCGMGILLRANTAVVVVIGASLAGFGLAPVYPITIARLSKEFGTDSSRTAGLLFALAGLGGAILPWVVGFSSTRFASLKIGLLVPLVSAAIMTVIYLGKRQGVSEVGS